MASSLQDGPTEKPSFLSFLKKTKQKQKETQDSSSKTEKTKKKQGAKSSDEEASSCEYRSSTCPLPNRPPLSSFRFGVLFHPVSGMSEVWLDNYHMAFRLYLPNGGAMTSVVAVDVQGTAVICHDSAPHSRTQSEAPPSRHY